MNNELNLTKTWIKVGIITGLLASVAYPLIIFAPLPNSITLIVAGAFGPLLSFASIGLYHFLKLHKKTVTAQIATVSNIIAGTLVNAMLIVQLAINIPQVEYLEKTNDESVMNTIKWVWKVVLGLDISWDIYIGLGTLLFAISALNHPRLGKSFGWAGIVIAGLLFGFNLYTFPDPPGDAGLIDVGPLVGLWYTAVTIRILFSLKWVNNTLDIARA